MHMVMVQCLKCPQTLFNFLINMWPSDTEPLLCNKGSSAADRKGGEIGAGFLGH